MTETQVQIPTPDGVADAYLYTLDDGKPHPGVVHLTDIHGIRPATRDMARRLAAEGYTVLLPNVFYRTRKPPMFDFPMVWGEERTMKRFADLTQPLTPDAMARDAEAYVSFLKNHAATTDGAMGAVGYCFTGQEALRIAAARPDVIRATASFHGGGLWTDAPTSPHLVLPRVKGELHVGHAAQDRSMPPEAIAKFDDALAAWGGPYESIVYDDARHGWTVPGGAAYDEAQAERAYANLTSLLARNLS